MRVCVGCGPSAGLSVARQKAGYARRHRCDAIRDAGSTPATLDTLAIAQLRCGQKVEALQTYLRVLDRLTETDPALSAHYDHFCDILYSNGQCR